MRRFFYSSAAICLLVAAHSAGETDTVTILHTNDINDHLRSGYDGVGGMAYVSGYVKELRAARPDVLLFDGGDAMEKGDLAAFVSESRITYEAMARVGYDACAVGNHDMAYGLDALTPWWDAESGVGLLCLNWLDDTGQRRFPKAETGTDPFKEVR